MLQILQPNLTIEISHHQYYAEEVDEHKLVLVYTEEKVTMNCPASRDFTRTVKSIVIKFPRVQADAKRGRVQVGQGN